MAHRFRGILALGALALLVTGTLGSCSAENAAPETSRAWMSRLLRYCAFWSACHDELVSNCVGESLPSELGIDRGRLDCAGTTKDCRQFLACDSGFTLTDQPCDEASWQDQCDGHRILHCVEGRIARLDCGDDQCMLSGTYAFCGCSEPCVTGACQGNTLLLCGADHQTIPHCVDCGRFDLSCAEGSGCVDEQQPVGGCTESTCDGSKIVQCIQGKTASRDCANLDPDLVCTHGNLCEYRNPECDPWGEPFGSPPGQLDTCVGDKVRVCALGRYFETDCTQAFGATCVVSDTGLGHCGLASD